MKTYDVEVTTKKGTKTYRAVALWILSAVDNVVQENYGNEATTNFPETKEEITRIRIQEI